MSNVLVDTWRNIILGSGKSWVLFGNGTCVILTEPETDLAAQAIELMKVWGPVYAGTPAGDFDVVELASAPGWVVTCHHSDILTYVGPDDIEADSPGDLMVGLLGRARRDRDAHELEVIHVEDRRPGAPDA